MPAQPSDKPVHEEALDTFLDPVLAGYVQDLEGGLQALRKTQSAEEHQEVTTLLCELSRDVLFRLGPVDEIEGGRERETVTHIAHLFHEAAEAIKPEGNLLIKTFKDHIYERAEILLGRKTYAASDSHRS